MISVDPKSILVAGGHDGDSSLNSFEILYSNESSSLTEMKLAELPYGISAQPSLFLHDDKILLCGGENNEKKCLMHDSDSWKEHSTLNHERYFASAVTTANGTFIFGGDDSKETFEFLQSKNPEVWRNGRSKIPDGFTTGCAVEVPEKQGILLIGGEGTNTRILNFDIKTQTFAAMNVSLLKERYWHTCGRLPDTNLIVITGGSDSNRYHDSTEFLNLDDNTIMLGNAMNTKRWGHGMTVITNEKENQLAVFGGNDENGHELDSVETLNPRTRKWEIVNDLKLKETKSEFGYISLHDDFIANL